MASVRSGFINPQHRSENRRKQRQLRQIHKNFTVAEHLHLGEADRNKNTNLYISSFFLLRSRNRPEAGGLNHLHGCECVGLISPDVRLCRFLRITKRCVFVSVSLRDAFVVPRSRLWGSGRRLRRLSWRRISRSPSVRQPGFTMSTTRASAQAIANHSIRFDHNLLSRHGHSARSAWSGRRWVGV